MRMLFAKLLVVVTGLVIVMLAILFAVIRNASEAPAPRPLAYQVRAASTVAPVGSGSAAASAQAWRSTAKRAGMAASA